MKITVFQPWRCFPIFLMYVSRPLHCLALCTFIASIGSGWLVEPKWSSCEVEYIRITSTVCTMRTLSVMPFQAFYYILNVFLLAPWLFIVFCAVLPCPRPRLKRQPSSPGEGHTKKGLITSRQPPDTPVNKHALFQSPPFLRKHLLPFPALCHTWPSSTPQMFS